MKHFSIRWVVALLPEAQPVIDRFHLKESANNSRTGFRVFTSKNGDIRLVLSGIGKTNAAAATAWLASCDAGEPVASLWLNFGIAGSSGLEYGSVCRADRVTDEESGRSWYPQAVWKKKFDLRGATVESVSRPTDQYPEGNRVVEMEAAGFYPIALKFASAELVQVVKVISDGPANPMKAIRPAIATNLCRDALDEIGPWLEAVADIAAEEQVRLDCPEGFQELLGKWHFTATQTHQLRRLLQQSRALKPDNTGVAPALIEASSNAREFLSNLRKDLWGE